MQSHQERSGKGEGDQKALPSSLGNGILYGIINAIVGIPTMISFAAIIFQARLCQLTMCMDLHLAWVVIYSWTNILGLYALAVAAQPKRCQPWQSAQHAWFHEPITGLIHQKGVAGRSSQHQHGAAAESSQNQR